MSKFFATLSDSDTESSSEEERHEVSQTEKKKGKTFNLTRDDDSDAKRIVRSAADKQEKELAVVINQISNQKKIRDCTNLLNSFGELVRVFEKYGDNAGLNTSFYDCIAGVDGFVSEIWKDTTFRQNMTKLGAKSLVALRQKVKKYVKLYADQISSLDKPTAADNIEGEAQLEIAEEKEPVKVDDESTDWGTADESSDSEVDSMQETRDYFLKKTVTEDKVKVEKKRVRIKAEGPKENEERGWQTICNVGGYSAEYQTFLKEEVSVASVTKFLAVLTSTKSRKYSNHRQKVHLLNELLDVTEAKSHGLPLAIKIKLSLATATLDSNLNHLSGMKSDSWEEALKSMSVLASSLGTVDFSIDPTAEEEEFEKSPFVIRSCVVSLVERLDEEFVKVLKDCDAYGDDYVNRLKDEIAVSAIVDKVAKYVERCGTDSARCRINLIKVSHLYFKYDKSAMDESTAEQSSLTEMDRLCKFIYIKDNTQVLRTRAILCQIYHFALHDKWIEARDLMLMSHLQENIQHSDPRTQMLFNRAMTQLGLCAFRTGRINDAHSCLADLVAAGRIKEVLGQGFSPYRANERTREQELLERQIQMPFHMHIPLELVEFVYLVSAMIIDVPYLTALDTRRRIISKPLYQLLRMIDKQCVVGPPENLREHLAAACRSLRAGQWQSCYNYLVNPKMSVKIWGKMQNSLDVQQMLESKIKSAALMTYVLSFASLYDSLSISKLAQMFDMEADAVNKQLASMIMEEELSAALDEPSDTLVPKINRRTILHSLVNQFVEKLSMLMETNERFCRFGQKASAAEGRTAAY